MMTLLLALTAGALASEAVPEHFVYAVEQIESSGRGAATPDGDGGLARGPLQWHAAAWSDCSEIRRDAGLDVWPYSSASDPVRSRDYARTWLSALKLRLTKKLGRSPCPGEIWLAWNLGWTGFSRYGFQWAMVPPEKFAKALQINVLYYHLPRAKRPTRLYASPAQ